MAPIEREILRTAARWNLDIDVFGKFQIDLYHRITQPSYSKDGQSLAARFVEQLADCEAFKAGEKYETDWANVMERKMLAEYAAKAVGKAKMEANDGNNPDAKRVAKLGTQDALRSLGDEEEAASTTPLSSDYEVSIRMTPERENRVEQAGHGHSDNAAMSQRRTSGSVGSFFWRIHPNPI